MLKLINALLSPFGLCIGQKIKWAEYVGADGWVRLNFVSGPHKRVMRVSKHPPEFYTKEIMRAADAHTRFVVQASAHRVRQDTLLRD